MKPRIRNEEIREKILHFHPERKMEGSQGYKQGLGATRSRLGQLN